MELMRMVNVIDDMVFRFAIDKLKHHVVDNDLNDPHRSAT